MWSISSPPEEALKAVADVWCAVSAATIFRAAFMLHRALESDSPIGIPLHKLDWPSNKRLRASYWYDGEQRSTDPDCVEVEL